MLRTQLIMLWKFLGFFQDPFTRKLHAVLVVLITLQLLGGTMVSASMFGLPGMKALPLWGHATSGLLILLLSLVLTVNSLRERGIAHFFPYLFSDTAQLRRDIRDSLHLKVIGPRPGGLASSVQGLGLCALLLTACSGATWLVLRLSGVTPLFGLTDLHGTGAVLIAIYFAGHGSMALIHFTLWQKKVRGKARGESVDRS